MRGKQNMKHHIAVVAFLDALPDRDVVDVMRHVHRHRKIHFLRIKAQMLAQAART
jgi:hypothetical protein